MFGRLESELCLKQVIATFPANISSPFCFNQITTHSRLLSQANSRSIASAVGFRNQESRCISLQEFNTEQQFIKTLE